MISEIRYKLALQARCWENHLYSYHLLLAFRNPKRHHRLQRKKIVTQVRSNSMQCRKKMEVHMSKKQRYYKIICRLSSPSFFFFFKCVRMDGVWY